MAFNPNIFKAYDIRGIYPDDLDLGQVKNIARAFAVFTKAKTAVVGRDMRASGDALTPAIIEGLVSQGVNVIDIGLCTTPMFNFAVASNSVYEGGIMVTASHNPKEFNGFKMTLSDGLPIGRETGMPEIRDLAKGDMFEETRARGTVTKANVLTQYLDTVFSLIDVSFIRPMKVVVDTGNGMEGMIAPELFRRLPQITLVPMYFELDGTFPNHEANPIKEENIKDLKARVLLEKADLGIAYDADADRIGFVDEKGEGVSGDLMIALLARVLLQKHAGGTVLYDIRSSNAVPEEVERSGGKPKMSMVGHALIKKMMRETGAIFGGEFSSHYYYKDFYTVESGDLTTLLVLKHLSDEGKSLSELVAPLRKYAHSGEINFKVEDKEAVMGKVAERFRAEAKSETELDGIRMDFEDWWFSLRPSNTESLLRLIVEAKTEKMMKEKVKEIEQVLGV